MKNLYFLTAVVAYVAISTNAYAQELLCPIFEQPHAVQSGLDGFNERIYCEPIDPPPPPPPPPPPCPVALPVPAQEWQVECKAVDNVVRCNGALPNDVCQDHNSRALSLGLLTPAAYNWLVGHGYCAINPVGVPSILSICPVGCFEENTEILTVNGYGAEAWQAAKNITMDHTLFSLQTDALLSRPRLNGRPLERMVVGPEKPDLYVFAMSNGRKLRVTSHHAMVLSDGRIMEAKDVVEGDAFIGLDGRIVVIADIRREPTDADVYNFSVAVDTPQEHIIAAEGVLVGDLAWQSTLASEMESIRLRR